MIHTLSETAYIPLYRRSSTSVNSNNRVQNNETFQLFSILKCAALPMPPICNVVRNGGDFLFPVIRTTLNWGEGVIYVVVSILFAPGKRNSGYPYYVSEYNYHDTLRVFY